MSTRTLLLVPIKEDTTEFGSFPLLGGTHAYITEPDAVPLREKLHAGKEVFLLPYGSGEAPLRSQPGQIGVLAKIHDLQTFKNGVVMMTVEALQRAEITSLQGEETTVALLEDPEGNPEPALATALIQQVERSMQINKHVQHRDCMESVLDQRDSLVGMVTLLQHYLGRELKLSGEAYLQPKTLKAQTELVLARLTALLDSAETHQKQSRAAIAPPGMLPFEVGAKVVEGKIGPTVIEDLLPHAPNEPDSGPVYRIVGEWGMPEYLPLARAQERLRPLISPELAAELRQLWIDGQPSREAPPTAGEFETARDSKEARLQADMLLRLVLTTHPTGFKGEGIFNLTHSILREVALVLKVKRDDLMAEVLARHQPPDYSYQLEGLAIAPALRAALSAYLPYGWRWFGAAQLSKSSSLSGDLQAPAKFTGLPTAPGIWHLLGRANVYQDDHFDEIFLVEEQALPLVATIKRRPLKQLEWGSNQLYLLSEVEGADGGDDPWVTLDAEDPLPPPEEAGSRKGFALEDLDSETGWLIVMGSTRKSFLRSPGFDWFEITERESSGDEQP